MRIAAASTAALMLCGCALFSARPPESDRSVGEVPNCNPGKGAVGLDATFAVVLGIGFLALASESEAGPAIGMAVGSAIYGGSAAYGNKSANRCKAALAAANLERSSGGEWAARFEDDGEDAAAPVEPVKPVEVVLEPEVVKTGMGMRPEAETEAETETETEAESEAEAEAESGTGLWDDFWKEISR